MTDIERELYNQREDKRRAEHYVEKWISEQGYPKDSVKEWALRLVEYAVAMERISKETEKQGDKL